MTPDPTSDNNEAAARLNRVMEAAQAASKVSPEEARDNALGIHQDGEFIKFNEESIDDMQF